MHTGQDNQKPKPTIFIVIVKGFIVRNLLRSGVLEHLKRSGARVILLISDVYSKGLPEYLKEEFSDDQVIVEPFVPFKRKKFHRQYSSLVRLLSYNKATQKISNRKRDRSRAWFFFENMLFGFLSRSRSLKQLARAIDYTFFSTDFYNKYFDTYNPDIVFSASVISQEDMAFLKEARRRGIKTVSMPKVWDNVTTRFYKFVPDRMLVQNGVMQKGLREFQMIDESTVRVCGFPQFDWYRREDIIMPREEFFKRIGLDPDRRLILWGSSGVYTPEDKNIPSRLIQLIQSGVFEKPASLLIRSHFTDAYKKRFNDLADNPHVAIDDNFTHSNFFIDRTDPNIEEIKQFVNTIYHADILITLCSTLVLDAFCLNKPVINTGFGGLYDKRGKDITTILYEYDHYQPILEHNAVDLVSSEAELIESINRYLLHPEHKTKERKQVLDTLCYKVDGNSSKRVADAVLSV